MCQLCFLERYKRNPPFPSLIVWNIFLLNHDSRTFSMEILPEDMEQTNFL